MKLTQGDVEKIVVRVVDYGLSTAFVARQFGVTRRKVQLMVKHYMETGKVPVFRRPGRKPYAKYPENLMDEVLETWKRHLKGSMSHCNHSSWEILWHGPIRSTNMRRN